MLNPIHSAYHWMKPARFIKAQDKNMQRIALVYTSDFYIAYGGLIDRHVSPAVILSLDHSVWFHGNVDFSNWHLFVQNCIRSSQEKPLNIARYECMTLLHLVHSQLQSLLSIRIFGGNINTTVTCKIEVYIIISFYYTCK